MEIDEKELDSARKKLRERAKKRLVAGVRILDSESGDIEFPVRKKPMSLIAILVFQIINTVCLGVIIWRLFK